MYEQENIRNNEQPRYSRLKTSVRRHIDQTMRMRNFGARNEKVERGAATKSQKKEKSQRGEESGRMPSVQCSRGDSCSGNRRDQRQEGQPSSPAPKAKAQTGEKKLSKSSGHRGESPSGTRGKIPCRKFLRESVRVRHVISGTLPCLNHKSESGCTYGDKCRFRHVEADGQPSKKSKKSGVKGPVAL